MGDGICCDPYVVPSRQDTDELVSRNTPPTRGTDRISDPFTVDGHSIVRLSAMSDQPFEVEVEVTETCQQTNIFRRPLIFRSIPDLNGNQFINVPFAVAAPQLRIVESVVGLVQPIFYQLKLIAQPIGCCDPGAFAGIGSPVGPGQRVRTKADLVVPAATETDIIVAADIPPGTRGITIVNVGSNPIRIHATGEGPGLVGPEVLGNGGVITFQGRYSAIDLLSAFSTLGTTLAFLFLRD